MSAVFVAKRESVEEIFDRGKADPMKIGRSPGADALQVLKRGLEKI